jgi:hypothetical protein
MKMTWSFDCKGREAFVRGKAKFWMQLRRAGGVDTDRIFLVEGRIHGDECTGIARLLRLVLVLGQKRLIRQRGLQGVFAE